MYRYLLFGLLSFSLFTLPAFAQETAPDLRVTEVTFFSENNSLGEQGTLRVQVENIGSNMNASEGLFSWIYNVEEFFLLEGGISGYAVDPFIDPVEGVIESGQVVTFTWQAVPDMAGILPIAFGVNHGAFTPADLNPLNDLLVDTVEIRESDRENVDIDIEIVDLRLSERFEPEGPFNMMLTATIRNNGAPLTNPQSLLDWRHNFAEEGFIFSRENGDQEFVTNRSLPSEEFPLEQFEELQLIWVGRFENEQTRSLFFEVDVSNALIESDEGNNVLEVSVTPIVFEEPEFIEDDEPSTEPRTTQQPEPIQLEAPRVQQTPLRPNRPVISNTPENANTRQEFSLKANRLRQDLPAVLSQTGQVRNVDRERATQTQFLAPLKRNVPTVSAESEQSITNFITYGVDDVTKALGERERNAVLLTYKNAYGKLPETPTEFEDVIKIASGRFPAARSQEAERLALEQFRRIYKRIADTTNPNDEAAIAVMAYGLRQPPQNRNLDSERQAINTFRDIFARDPQSTEDWNMVQAIAYAGPTRLPDRDKDFLPDAREALFQANPDVADSDGDGFLDGIEVENGYNPVGVGRL